MKLESLKKFKMQDNQLSSIYGGLFADKGKWVKTGKSVTTPEGCTQTTSDSFNDTNGNGKLDEGESYTVCTSVDCP
jgi:hypothetical protein